MSGLSPSMVFITFLLFCIFVTLWESVLVLKRIAKTLEEANKIKKGDKL